MQIHDFGKRGGKEGGEGGGGREVWYIHMYACGMFSIFMKLEGAPKRGWMAK